MQSKSNFYAKSGYYKPKASTRIDSNSKVQKSSTDSLQMSRFSIEYKTLICKHSYLGKKGYTIPKEFLEKEDLDELYKDLYCKPVTFGPQAIQESAFPVYKENVKKIYIPRFYGIERYGLPEKSEIEYGESINLTFEKPLRDYQDKIIDVYMKHVIKPTIANSVAGGLDLGLAGGLDLGLAGGLDLGLAGGLAGGGILEVPCGRGKCLAKDTEILMYNGTIKFVQDVAVGDIIMGDDSTPRTILSLARGRETMYQIEDYCKIIDKVNSGYIVNKSHILSLKLYNANSANIQTHQKVYDYSIEKYLSLPKYYRGVTSPIRGYRVPITFKKQPITIRPYTMGYNCGNDELYYTHIPHNYKCNIVQIQLELLAGIIDYSGQVFTKVQVFNNEPVVIKQINESTKVNELIPKIIHGYAIIQTVPQIIIDIIFMARSLGFGATKMIKEYKLDANGLIQKTYYKTIIYGNNLQQIPTKQIIIKFDKEYNKEFVNQELDNPQLYPIQLTKLKKDDYYGFEIDGNHRFVLGDFTVTHNTVMALKIISLIRQKTLIIVHKEFLLNQWIDRIQEFLPQAKVGKIQGQIFDIEGKDIVLGMLQTLYEKEFTINGQIIVNPFSSFGLTIIDEVHRIGSEQFSKTLLRILTPYMLGISATVERKDKLTKILYMFIGPKIYSEQREDEDLVCVRAIEYASSDPEFNELVQDYRGNTQYSSMITKLCAFGPRCDFIVQVIADLVEESPESQIMILAHNRCLLTYFYEAINHRQIAPVGYYVGGMKQKDLQITENKQIVLATYAMAAEALDIKTLSTLIMATPKTDIIQSVGRILRVRHDNPIVVDIVDSHDIFRNQWKQRKTFYKKCNYRIRSIPSIQYKGMASVDWLGNDRTWTRVFEPKTKLTQPIISIDDDDDDETPQKKLGKCMIEFEDLDDANNEYI